MKKRVGIVLLSVVILGTWKIGEAVVPSSLSLNVAEEKFVERLKIIEIIEKLEHHENENIHFLNNIRKEMRDIR